MLYLARLSDQFVRQTALESARAEAAMLDENWRFYAERVDGLNPVKTDKGFFVFCSLVDLSDRKQVQAALEDSHAIHESLV